MIYFSIFDDFTTMLKPSKISYQKIIWEIIFRGIVKHN